MDLMGAYFILRVILDYFVLIALAIGNCSLGFQAIIGISSSMVCFPKYFLFDAKKKKISLTFYMIL